MPIELASQFLTRSFRFQVNALNLNRQVKGILLHSGFFMVSEVLAHQQSQYQTLVTGKSEETHQLSVRMFAQKPCSFTLQFACRP